MNTVVIENIIISYDEIRSYDVTSFGEIAVKIDVGNHAFGKELKTNHPELHNELRLKYAAKRAKAYRDKSISLDGEYLVEADIKCRNCGQKICGVEIEPSFVGKPLHMICKDCKEKVHE